MAISLTEANYGELVDPFNWIEMIAQKKLITPLYFVSLLVMTHCE